MKTDYKKASDGLQPLTNMDRIVHELARLMIAVCLFVFESADFLFLQCQTGLTWGNLSSYISRLESAGYVAVEKGFVDKKPYTMLVSSTGADRFQSVSEGHGAVL